MDEVYTTRWCCFMTVVPPGSARLLTSA